jgi:molybdate transport system substrate-binding protein
MSRPFLPLAAALTALLLPGRTSAAERPAPREVRIAAAADLRFALDAVLSGAEPTRYGVKPVVIYGSSGSFLAQIENGAPFDLFLSADADDPRRLAARGLADGEVFLYAVGRIAVWVPSASGLDLGSLGLRALLDASVRKVAIANPRHAPYGRAAEAALRSADLLDAVRPKLVLGENVAQAAHFVRSGAADAGIVALSLALSPPMRASGRHVEVPPATFPRLDQGGIVLKGARNREDAVRVRDLLLAPGGREVLKAYGFFLPAP